MLSQKVVRAGPSILDCIGDAMCTDTSLTVEEAVRTVPVGDKKTVIHNTAIIDVSQNLRVRTVEYLSKNSFGLEIMSVDVGIVMASSAAGLRPVWMVIYHARGLLIGSQNYPMQGTAIDNPFISDEDLHDALDAGCASLREARAAQGNGIRK